ncbi:MarR family winged helix-turn-helix transcriptional regulator [Microbacterium murale]|uniref:MarR family transcriptional regulator n=1 Tax=Microbacterium murale TaxID=1081040 RepID=A0ABQ1RQ28_9MICO|nr:MarR family transcriptional regulator [Microbacterium murale]GGD77511.1 MarR family transcriptional regulator [Microbacterium murale]
MSDPSRPAVLDGDELATWSSLATLLEWLPTALDAQLLGDSEVSHFEYGILYALADAPEATLRMSVLAGYANSSLSRLSRAAARLEKRGWMRRTPDPADGRFTLAILTDAGLAKVEQASPGHVNTVRRLVIDPLTTAQLTQLKEISRLILGAIRQDDGWRPAVDPHAASRVRPSPQRTSSAG